MYSDTTVDILNADEHTALTDIDAHFAQIRSRLRSSTRLPLADGSVAPPRPNLHKMSITVSQSSMFVHVKNAKYRWVMFRGRTRGASSNLMID